MQVLDARITAMKEQLRGLKQSLEDLPQGNAWHSVCLICFLVW